MVESEIHSREPKIQCVKSCLQVGGIRNHLRESRIPVYQIHFSLVDGLRNPIDKIRNPCGIHFISCSILKPIGLTSNGRDFCDKFKPILFSCLQHVVLQAVLGTKKVERFKSSLTEFTKFAMDNVSYSDLTVISC